MSAACFAALSSFPLRLKHLVQILPLPQVGKQAIPLLRRGSGGQGVSLHPGKLLLQAPALCLQPLPFI